MTYLMIQMLLCLLLAFLLGLFIGCWFCKGCRKSNDSVEEYTRANIAPAEKKVSAPVSSIAAASTDTVIDLDSAVALSSDGYTIETLEGIGPKIGSQMRSIGIPTIEEFLRRAYLPEQRSEIADEISLRQKMVDNWACMSDLLRVEGIDHQSAELIFKSGVKLVSDLAEQDAGRFVKKMHEVNTAGAHLIAPTVPETQDVEHWIRRAENMKSVVRLA